MIPLYPPLTSTAFDLFLNVVVIYQHVVVNNSTRWLEETSKHISVPSQTNSRLHFLHNFSPKGLATMQQAAARNLFRALSRPQKGLREAPLWAPTLTAAALHSRQQYQMHLAATDAADQGFSLKAKSHQAFGESLLLAGQVSLWQIAQVLNSNYGPLCVWSFKNSCWHGTVQNCACVRW